MKTNKQTYKVSKIRWITDDASTKQRHRVYLPHTLYVTVDTNEVTSRDEAEDFITDKISDKYGYLHQGYLFDPITPGNKRLGMAASEEDYMWYDSTDGSGYDKNIPKSVFHPR